MVPSSEIRNIHVLCSCSKIVPASFTMMSNLAITIPAFINKVRVVFITEKQLSLPDDWKIFLSFQKLELLSIELTR